jgi:hypothetical protein
MRCIKWIALPVLCALPLVADALQRTFVASNGVDTNPCNLVAPCRTFGIAIGAVNAGGEVIVLDSAGYGAVTIGKSVSIISPAGIYAGVSVFGGAGVTVDGAGINVVLRGLSINNQGGSDGIDFMQGSSLHIENCVISGFSSGAGINVQATTSVTHVVDTIVRDGQLGIVFGGSLAGNISRTRIEHNTDEGIEVIGSGIISIEDSVVTGSQYNIDVFPLGFGDNAEVTVARTLVSGGSYGIIAEPDAAFATAKVTVMDSTIFNALVAGISAAQISGTPTVMALRNQLQGNTIAARADGATATLILDGNAIGNNVTGVSRTNSATIVTRDNNTVNANASDAVGRPYSSLLGI